MLISVLGALLAGGLASFALPFLPFAAAVTLAAVIGAVVATLQTHAPAVIALDAFALLCATQVGYAFGLIGQAAADHRSSAAVRASDHDVDQPEMRSLRFEEKP